MRPIHCFKTIQGKWKQFLVDLDQLWNPRAHPSLSYSPAATTDLLCFTVTVVGLNFLVGRCRGLRGSHRTEDTHALFSWCPDTGKQGERPAAFPNPCLNTSINNSHSKVHCQRSLDPTGAGRDKWPKKDNWCIWISDRETAEEQSVPINR